MKTELHLEDDVIKGFKQGDPNAVQKVYDLHYAPLCFFAFKMVSNYKEAEDIAAETLAKLWRLRANFDSSVNIRAFLYITTRNQCLDYLRSLQKQQSREAELFNAFANAKEESIFNDIVRIEILEEIYQEIESLPLKRKTVFKLFYIEGLNIEEISKKLKMTTTTVRTNKFKALEQLRNNLFNRKLLPVFFFLLLTAITSITNK